MYCIWYRKIASGLFPYIRYAVTGGVGAVLPPFPAKTYSQGLNRPTGKPQNIDGSRTVGLITICIMYSENLYSP